MSVSDRARKRNCKKLKIRQIDCPVRRDAARMFAKLLPEVGGSYASVFRARLMKYRKWIVIAVVTRLRNDGTPINSASPRSPSRQTSPIVNVHPRNPLDSAVWLWLTRRRNTTEDPCILTRQTVYLSFCREIRMSVRSRQAKEEGREARGVYEASVSRY